MEWRGNVPVEMFQLAARCLAKRASLNSWEHLCPVQAAGFEDKKGSKRRMPVGFFVVNCTRCKCFEPWDWGGGANATRLLGSPGGQPGDHVRHWVRHLVCVVGTGGQDGSVGEEVGSRGQHVWQKVKKTSACCFTPCQLLRPGLTTQSALSLFFQGSWQGGPSCPEGHGVPFS